MKEKVMLAEEQTKALHGFKRSLEDDGKSPRTVESYIGDVEKFLCHLNANAQKSIEEIGRADATTFFAELVQIGLKPTTVNKAINSLASFCQYLKETGTLPENVIVVVPRKDRVKIAAGSETEVSVFSKEQIDAILALAGDSAETSQRNRLIVHLLLYSGVRVGELVGIKIADVDIIANLLTVRGKGKKLREIPLKTATAKQIKEYLRGERACSKFSSSEYLLVSQRAPKMHRDAINTMFEEMAKKLGFPMHPHQFRHTFCSTLVQKGVPLTTVAKLAGHAGVETTAKFYVSTSRLEKARAVEML